MAPLSSNELITLQRILSQDEGVRKFPYLDCCGLPWRDCQCQTKGKLTIGIGRNLDDLGLSDSEIIQLQQNDVKKMTADLERNFGWFHNMDTARRIVIVSMAFNLGIQGLKNFKNMIRAIEVGNFNQAAEEMLESQWSTQVKDRAIRLASIMKSGTI
jgi:lysozyme